MDGAFPLLILLAVAALLSGPIALIVALVALRRIEEMRREMDSATMSSPVRSPESSAPPIATASVPEKAAPEPMGETGVVSASRAEPPAGSRLGAEGLVGSPDMPLRAYHKQADAPPQPRAGLEQRIGTRWILVAGVVTVIFAVGFFLKYAYENQWIEPWGRVLIAGFGGLVALALGEVTRRRGYDFVAKGVTALGFAVLYATVFAAHRSYGLIGSAPAYILAVGVTVGAMLYAVVLDEVGIALLSLAGGYVTPLVLSTGQNVPNPLFAYALILSTGAMLCAYWRKWSAVNILAFLGTYTLYTAWFERCYRPLMDIQWPPPQVGVALFWLAVFFMVFLILPVLHTLLRRVRSEIQDALLLLANAAVAFYYLWTMLAEQHEHWLALCSLIMGSAYLGLMALVSLRCRADADLRNALLIAGLAFLSLAVPLRFETHAIAILWAVEATALTAVGLRYRNVLVQAAAGAALALAVGKLAAELSMHDGVFRPVLNTVFASWCLVAVAAVACHVLYRFDRRCDADLRRAAAQVLYAAGLLLLMTAIGIELWSHEHLNRPANGEGLFLRQMTLVVGGFLLLFAVRPLCPPGRLCRTMAGTVAILGLLALVALYNGLRGEPSVIFLNEGFARATVLIAAVFTGAWLLRREERAAEKSSELATFVASAGILVLWLVMTREIWLHYRSRRTIDSWRFLAQMYISVLWAVYATGLMIVGFWRRVKPLRYIALGIFLLLLAKIFLVDTRTVEAVYRIAGFLATGLALVGVSYLYQYLKKKGFFESVR